MPPRTFSIEEVLQEPPTCPQRDAGQPPSFPESSAGCCAQGHHSHVSCGRRTLCTDISYYPFTVGTNSPAYITKYARVICWSAAAS
jgi:hypothetical protein